MLGDGNAKSQDMGIGLLIIEALGGILKLKMGIMKYEQASRTTPSLRSPSAATS